MSEELKPGPFCGRRVEHVSRACNQSATGMTYIVSCFCGGYSACAHQQEDTLEEVVKAWNTRALTAAQPAQTDSMGMPTSCGKPLCSPDEHHPLCKLHQPAAEPR